jgi:hypothetical protein
MAKLHDSKGDTYMPGAKVDSAGDTIKPGAHKDSAGDTLMQDMHHAMDKAHPAFTSIAHGHKKAKG